MNQVIGTTKILNNGPDANRLNLVFLAEGYTDTQQTDFANDCNDIVAAIQNEPWFGDLINAINVHRIDVESNESGADDPDCGGDGAGTTADTFFDATFCGDGVIRRLLVVDQGKAEDVLDDEVPQWHAAVVLVNTSIRGGAGGNIATSSTHGGDWVDVVLHELGHSLFGLADEYEYWAGCGIDTDRDNAPAGEPIEPNVTAQSSISGLKWRHWVNELTTPIPTMENPDCSTCDSRPNALGDNTIIGLYEGAKYYHCGRYRPAYTCKMRSTSSTLNPFCRVCVEAIHDRIRPFFGTDPELAAAVNSLNFGSIGTGATRTLDFEISNLGTVNVTGISISVNNGNYTFITNPAVGILTPGSSAMVEVTLGPVLVVGNQPGNLTISSNDDDIVIALTGNICAAAPSLGVIPVSGSTLDFGDVSQGLTMYRSFEVRNNKLSCPGPLRVVLMAPVGNFSFAPATVLDFVLPAPQADEDFTSQVVYVAFTASTSVTGPETGSLILTTPDNPSINNVNLDLVANVIPETVVDTVLVIDRSGSMLDPTGEASNRKIDHAIFAGDLYIDLMKNNDSGAVVKFSTEADVLIGLTTAGELDGGTGRNNLKNAISISNLNPSGLTSVGSGIIEASNILDGSSADTKAIIVLTDGRENRVPNIAQANAVVSGKSPRQRVFAVGLGLNQLEENLELIASLTDGYTQITPNLAGTKEFLLQKMYIQIISDVDDAAFIKDPYHILRGGEEQYTEIQISELEISVDFIVCFRTSSVHPKYMKIRLEAPNGTIIDSFNAAAFPNLSIASANSHILFRLLMPFFPTQPQAHIGTWKVWIKNFYSYEPVYTHYSENHPLVNPLVYSVMCKAKSNFLLKGALFQDSYSPNSPFNFVLEPTMHGIPIKLDHNPIITIRRPDGIHRQIQLSRTEDGIYTGSFLGTYLSGVYSAETEVVATSPMNFKCTRYKIFTGVITRKSQETYKPNDQERPSNTDFIKCCEELKKLLIEINERK